MNRYGDLDDFKRAAAKPYRERFLDLEILARKAEAEADPISAAHYRHQARILHRHLRRLDSL